MKTIQSAMFQPIGMIGKAEAEETEEAASQERERSFEPASETEFDERKLTFAYLDEHRKHKKLKEKLECLRQAGEGTQAEMARMLEEDAQRAREAERTMSGEAAVGNADVGISYDGDENGKMVKQRPSILRTSARRRAPAAGTGKSLYVQNENGEFVPYVPPPRRFTRQDGERAHRNSDRLHTRSWWLKRLAIDEGKETMTKQQLAVHMAIGRANGWHRPKASKR